MERHLCITLYTTTRPSKGRKKTLFFFVWFLFLFLFLFFFFLKKKIFFSFLFVSRCVKLLLDHGADVNLVDRNGCSPLHVACYIGALASVKSLVSAGARLDVLDERGHSVLHKACFSGNERVLQFLLQTRKVELEAVDKSKRTCLHVAALLGKAKALTVLLEAGLKISLPDANNCTALHLAVTSNQVQTVQVLLSYKADTAAKVIIITIIY